MCSGTDEKGRSEPHPACRARPCNPFLTSSPHYRGMHLRTRARAILVPLALYLVLGVASGYLVWGASNGERGLKAKVAHDAQMAQLQDELAGLRRERARWERR